VDCSKGRERKNKIFIVEVQAETAMKRLLSRVRSRSGDRASTGCQLGWKVIFYRVNNSRTMVVVEV